MRFIQQMMQANKVTQESSSLTRPLLSGPPSNATAPSDSVHNEEKLPSMKAPPLTASASENEEDFECLLCIEEFKLVDLVPICTTENCVPRVCASCTVELKSCPTCGNGLLKSTLPVVTEQQRVQDQMQGPHGMEQLMGELRVQAAARCTEVQLLSRAILNSRDEECFNLVEQFSNAVNVLDEVILGLVSGDREQYDLFSGVIGTERNRVNEFLSGQNFYD